MVASNIKAERILPSELPDDLRRQLIGQPVKAVSDLIDLQGHEIEVDADGSFAGTIYPCDGGGVPCMGDADMVPVVIDGDRVRPATDHEDTPLLCERDTLLGLGWYQRYGDDEWCHEEEEE